MNEPNFEELASAGKYLMVAALFNVVTELRKLFDDNLPKDLSCVIDVDHIPWNVTRSVALAVGEKIWGDDLKLTNQLIDCVTKQYNTSKIFIGEFPPNFCSNCENENVEICCDGGFHARDGSHSGFTSCTDCCTHEYGM